MTPLQQAAKKVFPEYVDVDYHMEVLTSFPEGEWFQPMNKDNEAFTVCTAMEDCGLIEMKRQPIWRDGSRRGCKIFFRYKHDLNFSS